MGQIHTYPGDLTYPCNVEYAASGEHGVPTINTRTSFGLTKREYFASLFMNGLLSSWGNHDVTDMDEIASDAVKAADKLIYALNNVE